MAAVFSATLTIGSSRSEGREMRQHNLANGRRWVAYSRRRFPHATFLALPFSGAGSLILHPIVYHVLGLA